ncbi:MAG: S-adenosylmethionine:tRNA ribosyltransferase-isomerase [Bacteroidales bacterium]|nr:S-adenosylmethionine:tRNA ribosyltransferase-isomerase [Bacteroidales bacterium]
MRFNPKKISIEDFAYGLPQGKIAQFPLEQRDTSKLLLLKDGKISQDKFFNIPDHIPENSLLVFNNTKVIQARLLFQKPTGATIEIFCLEPVSPVAEIQHAFQQSSPVVWKCFIGNARRWKSGGITKNIKDGQREIVITAKNVGNVDNTFLIEFSWEPTGLFFSQILEMTGLVPLPPYINRKAIEHDKETYQTVYARHNGSVAAPTAGLHFTPEIFSSLKKKSIKSEYLTLHVGAGTFTPVVDSEIKNHKMHMEHIMIDRDTISSLSGFNDGKIISVGTTTVRSLESLYWFGVKLIVDKDHKQNFIIGQWDPYEHAYKQKISKRESYMAVLEYMDKNELSSLQGVTQLIIVPGYDYKVIDGLITNFHQPRSTLLLLVAALIGDIWKQAYDYALDNDFRFLSYGDSCLFLP